MNKKSNNPANIVREKLVNASGHPIDVCASLIELMDDSKNPVSIFREIIEYSDWIGDKDDDSPRTMTLSEYKSLAHQSYNYIIETVKLLSDKNLDIEAFYTQLYRVLFENTYGLLGSSKGEKAVFLEIIVNHCKYLPYYQLDDFEDFEQDEFEDIVDRIFPVLRKARHVLYRDLDTYTKESHHFLDSMNGLASEKEKIVYLAMLIKMLRTEKNTDSSEE